jgi:hypothetical protein
MSAGEVSQGNSLVCRAYKCTNVDISVICSILKAVHSIGCCARDCILLHYFTKVGKSFSDLSFVQKEERKRSRS